MSRESSSRSNNLSIEPQPCYIVLDYPITSIAGGNNQESSDILKTNARILLWKQEGGKHMQ